MGFIHCLSTLIERSLRLLPIKFASSSYSRAFLTVLFHPSPTASKNVFRGPAPARTIPALRPAIQLAWASIERPGGRSCSRVSGRRSCASGWWAGCGSGWRWERRRRGRGGPRGRCGWGRGFSSTGSFSWRMRPGTTTCSSRLAPTSPSVICWAGWSGSATSRCVTIT